MNLKNELYANYLNPHPGTIRTEAPVSTEPFTDQEAPELETPSKSPGKDKTPDLSPEDEVVGEAPDEGVFLTQVEDQEAEEEEEEVEMEDEVDEEEDGDSEPDIISFTASTTKLPDIPDKYKV